MAKRAFAVWLGMGLLQVTAWPILIPPPIGRRVAWDNLELVNHNHQDPFNSSHPRRIMVSHFYPVDARSCRVTYMPPCVAANVDNNIQGELDDAGLNVTWPAGVLSRLQLDVGEVCEGNRTMYPRLLFGPGFNETRLGYSAMAQQISSMGYEVIVMDHPYETDVVLFPNGEIVYGRLSSDDASNRTFALDVRRQDAAFVLDHFGINATVYLGHSFGGAAAFDAQLWSPRVLASVNLDGALIGPVISQGAPRPVLAIGSASHVRGANYDPTWEEFFTLMASKHPQVWAKNLNIKGSQHNSLSDYSMIADLAHLRDNEALVEDYLGEITGKRIFVLLRTLIGAFLDFTLYGEPGQVFSGPSEKYPEVLFYN